MVDQAKDEESVDVAVPPIPPEQPKTRKSWSRAKRELTDEELASPAALKMLLDEVERLDVEKAELTAYRDRFHEADKSCAILREQKRGTLAADVVFTGAMSLGGVLLGLSASTTSPTAFWELLAVGVLMIATGIAAKVIRR